MVAGFVFQDALCQEAQEARNPLQPQFPKKEEVAEPTAEQPIVIKEEKFFNVSQYALEGVVWGAYEARAIINGKIYAIGDIIGEAEIIKIGKEGVTVALEQKEYVIKTTNPTIVRKEEVGEVAATESSSQAASSTSSNSSI